MADSRSDEGKRCLNPDCERRDIRALERCQACYVFFRRHGRDIRRAEMRQRRAEAQCRVCGQEPQRSLGRCTGCYQYWRRTGEERYASAGDPGLCLVCGERPVYRHERCRSCYAYRRARGRDRCTTPDDS